MTESQYNKAFFVQKQCDNIKLDSAVSDLLPLLPFGIL